MAQSAGYVPTVSHRPLETSRRERFGAFDIETDGLDGDFIILTAQFERPLGGLSEVEVFNSTREFLDRVLCDEDCAGVVWYGHNAEYDWRYFIPSMVEYLDEYKIVPCVRGLNKIYQIDFYRLRDTRKRPKPALRMRDSLAVFPFALKLFAAKFSSKPKLDIGLASGTRFNKNKSEHVEYAKRDTETLLESMINYDTLAHTAYGVHLRGTTASTAYHGFLRHIPEGHSYPRAGGAVEEFVRAAYFGGIVYINKINTHIPIVHTFDINSSYPNVMEKYGIPRGRGTFTDHYMGESTPAFYHVRVDARGVPDDHFHFLAKRDTTSVCWARGRFITSITSREYVAALEHGYDIEVIRGCYFDAVEYPFNDFIAVCKRMRTEYKGQALEQVAKLMQNSLYGKFGMSPQGKEYLISHSPPDGEGWEALVGTLDRTTQDYVFSRSSVRDSEYMLPHWAAWITANARLEIVKAVDAAGNENFFYVDTDSVTVTPEGAARILAAGLVGSEYGLLKDEGAKGDWVCRGPKAYTWVDGDTVKVKMKGLPKSAITPDIAAALHRGEMPDVSYHVSRSFHSAVKHSTFGVDAHRRPTDSFKLQSWGLSLGGTRALPKIYDEWS